MLFVVKMMAVNSLKQFIIGSYTKIGFASAIFLCVQIIIPRGLNLTRDHSMKIWFISNTQQMKSDLENVNKM